MVVCHRRAAPAAADGVWRGDRRWAWGGWGCVYRSSGDLFIAFGLTAARAGWPRALALHGAAQRPARSLLQAVQLQATEEAVVNALVAGETMVGVRRAHGLAVAHRAADVGAAQVPHRQVNATS